MKDSLEKELYRVLVKVISETNAISLIDTLELLLFSPYLEESPQIHKSIIEFKRLLYSFQQDEIDINILLGHPFSSALFEFFKNFPINYHEEHIHLTGSLSAEFIYPHLKKLLEGPNKKIIEKKIIEVYGKDAIPINSVQDVDELIRLKDGEQFSTYLKILFLPKLILHSKKMHSEASYHMAKELYYKYNVGSIRLKFTLSRSTGIKSEQVPGLENVTEEDVVMGLYQGFMKFKKEVPNFNFILSPSFRKESKFFDNTEFKSKKDHFYHQVSELLKLMKKYPELEDHLLEVDTVGDEKELYRKAHFEEMKKGLRKLQFLGLKIRSHHGETWKTLKKGVQSVDNAMNIWHIDTLEHGLSLGVNPNYYFHRMYQNILKNNLDERPITKEHPFYQELQDMEWQNKKILNKLLEGKKLTEEEHLSFIKLKFNTARELEHYQHDILNRMIHKNVSLVSLPSSNLKLTSCFPDYKDHPFSWWEKKGVFLGIGTDNYITLSTNFIQELLILLYSDAENLKITKLLMVATKEQRRPFISHLLWVMRKDLQNLP